MRRKMEDAAAMNVNYAAVSQGLHANNTEKLMASTRHLRRGEFGLEVNVGNNSDNTQISVDGPAALVQEFLGFVYEAGFEVISVRPTKSASLLAA